jgi:hypothetical protein
VNTSLGGSELLSPLAPSERDAELDERCATLSLPPSAGLAVEAPISMLLKLLLRLEVPSVGHKLLENDTRDVAGENRNRSVVVLVG